MAIMGLPCGHGVLVAAALLLAFIPASTATCPLLLPPDLFDNIARHCNAIGSPNCCNTFSLGINRARALHANITGNLFLTADAASSCFQDIKQSLAVRQVSVDLFSTCREQSMTLWSENACAPAFTYLPNVTIGRGVDSCGGSLPPVCDVGCPDIVSLAALKMVQAQNYRDGRVEACEDLVRVILVGQAKDRVFASRCVWDPTFIATCTALDFASGVDYSPLMAAYNNPGAPRCEVMRGLLSLVKARSIATSGSLFIPPGEADACLRAFQEQLEAHNISRAEAARCGLAEDGSDFTTAGSSCGSLTSVEGVRVATSNFARLSRGCPPYTNTCNTTCRAAIAEESAVQQRSSIAASGCEEIITQSYLATVGTETTGEVVNCVQATAGQYYVPALPNYPLAQNLTRHYNPVPSGVGELLSVRAMLGACFGMAVTLLLSVPW